MDWLKSNWEFIAIIAGGIGTFWTFVGEKVKDRLRRPITQQKEKIEIDSDKIDLQKEKIDLDIKWQSFQNDRIEDAISKFNTLKIKSDSEILEMQKILDDRQNMIEDYKSQTETDKIFLKKHRMHIKYLENLLETNNIKHETLKESQDGRPEN